MSKIAIVFALMVVASMAVTTSHISSAQEKKINDLVHDKKWASIIMNLAELHLMAQGPIDTLVSAIQDVIADLEAKQERTHAEYDQRTSDHGAEVRRLNDDIRNAITTIANTNEHIDNVLIPQKEQLEEELVNLNQRVEDNQHHIDTATAQRDADHNEFVLRVDEHTSAIEAVSEALELLNSLEGDDSLVQITKSKKSLEKVHQKLKGKSVEAALVEALVTISTEQFSNHEQLDKVFQLLHQIDENLQTSLTEEQTNEAAALKAFNADIRATQADTQDSLAQIAERTASLSYTEEQIQESRELVEAKTAEEAQLNTDLQSENDSYDRATEAYNSLIEEYTAENDACSEALDVIQNANLADYISGRVNNESGVIDQSVGSRHGLNE